LHKAPAHSAELRNAAPKRGVSIFKE